MGISGTSIVLKPSGRGPDSFMPGDAVRGAVVVSITGSAGCKLTEVTLTVKGQARTHWTTHNGTWSSKHAQKETFLKLVLPVLRVKKGAVATLPPGENQLNFSFTLPAGLPHSRLYEHGEVAYKMVARAVSGPLGSAWNGTTKLEITMLQRRDLNALPHLARRLVVERKAKSSTSRREDPGQFTVMLPRQGFVAGETIDVYLDGSDEVLSALARNEGLVKLKRSEEFRAGSSTEYHKPVLTQKRLGLDPSEWRHFQLTVPRDDIGIDPAVCRIIAASHYIKIWDVHLPLTLGTIAFGKRSSSRPPSRTPSGARLASSQNSSRAPSRSPSGVALCQTPSRTNSGADLSQLPFKVLAGLALFQNSPRPPSRSPSGVGLCQISPKAPSRNEPQELGTPLPTPQKGEPQELRTLLPTTPQKGEPQELRTLLPTTPQKGEPQELRTLLPTTPQKAGPQELRTLLPTTPQKAEPQELGTALPTTPCKVTDV
ncbi:Arrestin domain-containing protein 17 [Amphibalanus amphitrite]|uniref:Arrestin domain-containing protein 17 n=1 Tax=Amphibalanus amphitrite TaxID=1232801 RepID=A0A6A4V597_AMPAM|nr:Arrestin domain-containing protein 17 [Amphibalanus amphitrite]